VLQPSEKTMPDEATAKELDLASPGEGMQGRRSYSPPKLTELGSLADLTRGGDQEQRGEGPGFSL